MVGALALVLFGVTAAPGVLWGDSAKLTLMALDVELIPQPGGHPTYVLLAALWVRLWPSDPAYALNMFSAISAAIAVALLYRSLRFSIGTEGAAFAAVTLACSHLFWNSATLAESYAPAAAILAGLLALSVGYFDDPRPWRLWLAALLLGLGAGINSIVIIALPALAIPLIHRWRQTGLRHVLPAVLFMGLGLVPFMVAGPWTRAAAKARLRAPAAASTAAVELASAADPAAWASISRTTASLKSPPESRRSRFPHGQRIRKPVSA